MRVTLPRSCILWLNQILHWVDLTLHSGLVPSMREKLSLKSLLDLGSMSLDAALKLLMVQWKTRLK